MAAAERRLHRKAGNMKKLIAGGALALGVIATPFVASAHNCVNPTKTVGAGSKTLVTLDSEENETVTDAGHGNGTGGFVPIDANALVPGVVVDVHTFGSGEHGGGKDGVAGPGIEKAGAKGCDGKGIDYIDSCFGAE